jgi:uncharacterized membrane protein YbaN (DUF454 family)
MAENSERHSRSPSEVNIAESRIARLLWVVAGTISLAVGVVGVVVPVLPTTPFLLIAAACYLRGSKRMYNWMVANRYLGGYLRDYLEGKGISIRAKAASILLLWTLIVLSAAFATSDTVVRVVLIAVAIGVTLHLLTLKTKANRR